MTSTKRASLRTRRIVKKLVLALVALALTVTLVGSAFYRPSTKGGLHLVPRFPLDEWLSELPSHLPWVAVFVLFSASMVPLRAFRWGFALGPRKGGYADRYHAIAIGLLSNNVIPAKLGEGVRALAFTRFTGMPFFQSLGTVVVCKLLDTFALLTLVLVAPGGPIFGGAMRFSGGLAGAAIAVPVLGALLVLIARKAPAWADALGRKGKAPSLERTLRNLSTGLRLNTWRTLSKAFLATLLAVASVATGYAAALRGVGVAEAGEIGGVVVLAAVTFGQSPPGVPAGLGMYYLACSWAARLLGASEKEAATLAVLTHMATALTHVTVGLVSALVRRQGVRDLFRRKKGAVDEAIAAEAVRTPA